MIKNNYVIYEYENELDYAKQLATLGVIQLKEIQYITCGNTCKQEIELNSSDDFEIVCPKCGKIIYIHSNRSIKKKYIQLIDQAGVLKYVTTQIKNIGLTPVLDKDDNSINITAGENTCKVIIMDYCLNTFLFDPTVDDYVLRIIADDNKCSTIVLGTEHYKFLTLDNLIKDLSQLKKRLDFIFSREPGQLDENLKLFNLFIRTPDPTGKKLEIFTEQLTNHIQNNREKTNCFMKSLERDEGNIWGAAIIPLSGSGHTDLTQVPLYPYLLELLTSNKNYECKFYPDSLLTPEKYGSMFLHAAENKKSGINLIAIGGISPSVYEQSMRSIKSNQEIKIIVINKFILLRILNGLDAFSLLTKQPMS